ncbi:hypothetical protein [Bacillus atrophaeus]|uniref:hypothetical protein n=1 Tax=Bacillus atrophaeus TaxID=1452 RepID=UPI001C129723|nr:hypothetical protein [Bacillus atrophaeus]MBU5262098.1 hypothetical protein [Bacillus atrophaeus]MCY8466530.1 hypothetical protein [Bacillus atrophaeus]MCY8478989.1 hypothetical protein [Bacillus atrophaeus]
MGKTGPKTEAGLQAVSESAKTLDHSSWTENPAAVQAIEVAKRLRQTKHGMYASVPIICKAEACPYAESCELQQMGIAPYSEKCPMEIAAIEDLFRRYCSDMNINPEDPSQQVDAIMVKEVVDIDISMLRCDKKMAISADFIIDQVISVTDDGDPISRQELHPLTEYKEKLRTQKYKTLNLLNSTRKDKEGSVLNINTDPSERAAEMMQIIESSKAHDEEEKKAREAYFKKIGKSDQQVIEVDPIEEDMED